jgi:hypothetical protein
VTDPVLEAIERLSAQIAALGTLRTSPLGVPELLERFSREALGDAVDGMGEEGETPQEHLLAEVAEVRYESLRASLGPVQDFQLAELRSLYEDVAWLRNEVAFHRGLLLGAKLQADATVDFESINSAAIEASAFLDRCIQERRAREQDVDTEAFADLSPDDF